MQAYRQLNVRVFPESRELSTFPAERFLKEFKLGIRQCPVIQVKDKLSYIDLSMSSKLISLLLIAVDYFDLVLRLASNK